MNMMFVGFDVKAVEKDGLELSQRIAERQKSLPGVDLSWLTKAADAANQAWTEATKRATRIGRPSYWYRVRVTFLILVAIAAVGAAIWLFALDGKLPHEISSSGADFLQGLGALVELILLVAVTIYWPVRQDRARMASDVSTMSDPIALAAEALHAAQEDFDPSRLFRPASLQTESSPKVALDPWQMERVLDYTGEVLALLQTTLLLYAVSAADLELRKPLYKARAAIAQQRQEVTAKQRVIWDWMARNPEKTSIATQAQTAQSSPATHATPTPSKA